MQVLLTALVTWLSANYPALPALKYELPAVRYAEPAEIYSIRYGAFSPERRRELAAAYAALPADQQNSIVSVYDDKARTIVLPAGWQGHTPAELSVLVHELVHHMQNTAGLTYGCPQEREALAYDAQDKWLGLFGRTLAGEFQIDGFTLIIKTKCLY